MALPMTDQRLEVSVLEAQQWAATARAVVPLFLPDARDAESIEDVVALLEDAVRQGTPVAFERGAVAALALFARRGRIRVEFRAGVGLGASRDAAPGDVLWVPTALARHLIGAGSAVAAPEGEPVPSSRPGVVLRFLRGVATSLGDKAPGDIGRLPEVEAQRLVASNQARIDAP